jgi:hypothetical protein
VSRQLWGCYAVNDHIDPHPFVADVLLYDRLVIPVLPEDPTPDEVRQWVNWQPEKQRRLLGILKGIAHPIPWTHERRDEYQQEKWSQADAMLDVHDYAAVASNPVGSKAPATGPRRHAASTSTEDHFAPTARRQASAAGRSEGTWSPCAGLRGRRRAWAAASELSGR